MDDGQRAPPYGGRRIDRMWPTNHYRTRDLRHAEDARSVPARPRPFR
jgi:hypothetical protein